MRRAGIHIAASLDWPGPSAISQVRHPKTRRTDRTIRRHPPDRTTYTNIGDKLHPGQSLGQESSDSSSTAPAWLAAPRGLDSTKQPPRLAFPLFISVPRVGSSQSFLTVRPSAPPLMWGLGSKLATMADRKRAGDYLMDIVMFAGMTATLYFLTKNILSSLTNTLVDPDKEKHEQASLKAKANLQRLRNRKDADAKGDAADGDTSSIRGNGPRVEDLVLNDYENQIALEVVAPEDITVGFDDIGGMDEIIEEVKEAVIYPLTMPHLYSHAAPLLAAPSGVLLYGPPGCGKTMLAKAVAHESGASFINLHISTLTEKWYGDSNKLVRAVFSLARKLQPAIIFIDEIDAVLGTRTRGEHEASGMVKAE
ncbi:ATPase family AAA domain-containing protein 1 [Magnaporthiopsis poae ATCC 64411]|uniref:ATPase family AAA domain-containing protein 1 n=1 Tax=Magnaporthiopsis poae (strain ATCC 64411 / 73-15) TaxID=644358 RepID=A0A0C4DYA3_MAGP6|nr:ATPase family AAA domain-containing protein 1 [Magnaporthiopsis poae ATCC 64411]